MKCVNNFQISNNFNKITQMSNLARTPQLNILAVTQVYFFLVKWFILKPLVKLSYIINGKMMGDVKWYQRHFTTRVKWKWLNSVTYKLTKYLMFS
jgi:hypothetical protein